MEITIKEIIEVTGAEMIHSENMPREIQKIEFDSSKIEAGDLFVPLQGKRDGHDFVQQAINHGAVATFWGNHSEELPGTIFGLKVKDPLTAMQDVAVYCLKKYQPKVIAITGSNGKTTTKDMTASVLSQKYKTYKTQGNYNNHIGMPYTILHMPADTEMLVLEMGMDHAGEITFLSQLAQPDVAAITLIGESHIEHFGSRLGIAKAKMEIIAGLKMGGLLVIPGQEEILADLIQPVNYSVLRFGTSSTNDIYPLRIDSGKKQTVFETNAIVNQEIHLPVLGTYNVDNALIAIAIGQYFKVPSTSICKGIEDFQLTQNRTEWKKAYNQAELLSDVYNANPTAMHVVLEHFSKLEHVGEKSVVLGDMLELGELSTDFHKSLAEKLHPEIIQNVFLYGQEIAVLYDCLKEKYDENHLHYFPKNQKQELLLCLHQSIQPTDMILLKGSNGMKLNEIVEGLQTSQDDK